MKTIISVPAVEKLPPIMLDEVNRGVQLDDMILKVGNETFDQFSYGHEVYESLPNQFAIAHYANNDGYIKVVYELYRYEGDRYKGIRDIISTEIF